MKLFKGYSISEIFRFFLSRYCLIEVHKMHYLRLNINIDLVNEKMKDFDLDVRPLTMEMIVKGDRNVFNGEKIELYKKRLQDSSYYGYGIIKDGSLIYSTWLSTEKLSLPLVTKKTTLLPNEGLLEDSYCAPNARGRGVHGKMNLFRIKKLYELGKVRVLAIVMDGNLPAMIVQKSCGFEDIGTFYLGRFFGFKFCTLNKEVLDKK